MTDINLQAELDKLFGNPSSEGEPAGQQPPISSPDALVHPGLSMPPPPQGGPFRVPAPGPEPEEEAPPPPPKKGHKGNGGKFVFKSAGGTERAPNAAATGRTPRSAGATGRTPNAAATGRTPRSAGATGRTPNNASATGFSVRSASSTGYAPKLNGATRYIPQFGIGTGIYSPAVPAPIIPMATPQPQASLLSQFTLLIAICTLIMLVIAMIMVGQTSSRLNTLTQTLQQLNQTQQEQFRMIDRIRTTQLRVTTPKPIRIVRHKTVPQPQQ